MNVFKNFTVTGALVGLLCGCQPADPKELHDAVRAGDQEKVKVALKQNSGAINAPDKAGNTALHLAVGKGDTAMVDLLLAQKASVNVRNAAEQTPLYRAISQNHVPIIKSILAQKPEANGRDALGHTLLQFAAQKGNKEVMAWLLSNKADVNAKNNFGKTAVVLAIQAKQGSDTLELLVKHGASLDWQDENGLTLLHLACSGRDPGIIEFLLNQKLDIHARDRVGNTPLHYAAEASQLAVLEVLIAHQADVRALNNDKLTPLQYAERPRQAPLPMGMTPPAGSAPGAGMDTSTSTQAHLQQVVKYLKKIEAGGK